MNTTHCFAERLAEILGGLRLARTRGSRGGAAEEHAERLRQRHVADVRQRRDHEALLHAEVLVRVLKVHVADGDDHRLPALVPVEAGTASSTRNQPGRLMRFFMSSSEVSLWCTCTVMHVSRFLRSFLPSVVLRRDDDHLLQQSSPASCTPPSSPSLLLLRHRQRGLHVVCPQELDTQERDLRGVAEDERPPAPGSCTSSCAMRMTLLIESCMPSTSAWSHDSMFPVAITGFVLQVAVAALAGDEGLERNLLALLREHLQHLVLVHLVERRSRSPSRRDRTGSAGSHRRGIRPERQNLQQRRVGDEVKAREHRPLRVQKRRESLLAQLELLGEHRQHLHHHLAVAAHLDDVLSVRGNLGPSSRTACRCF